MSQEKNKISFPDGASKAKSGSKTKGALEKEQEPDIDLEKDAKKQKSIEPAGKEEDVPMSKRQKIDAKEERSKKRREKEAKKESIGMDTTKAVQSSEGRNFDDETGEKKKKTCIISQTETKPEKEDIRQVSQTSPKKQSKAKPSKNKKESAYSKSKFIENEPRITRSKSKNNDLTIDLDFVHKSAKSGRKKVKKEIEEDKNENP